MQNNNINYQLDATITVY